MTDPSAKADAPPAEVAEGGTGDTKPARPAQNAAGMDRPAFVLGFPSDPELDRLVAAFEAGNYALIRREAEALAKKTERAEVRDAALELRRRIDPDPLAKLLLAVSAGLLVALTLWAYLSARH